MKPRQHRQQRPRPPVDAEYGLRQLLPNGAYLTVEGTYPRLAEAEAAMMLHAPLAPHPLRMVCPATGRWLDDYDAPNGRAYLTARDWDGTPIRTKRYDTDDERDEALKIMEWALSAPGVGPSEFDPRKLPT